MERTNEEYFELGVDRTLNIMKEIQPNKSDQEAFSKSLEGIKNLVMREWNMIQDFQIQLLEGIKDGRECIKHKDDKV